MCNEVLRVLKRSKARAVLLFLAFFIALPLAVGMLSPVNVHAASQTIQSGTMRVTVDDAFPRVVQYQMISSGAILYGQEDSLSQIIINDITYTPGVTFSKTIDTASYVLTIPQINVVISLNFKVINNVLQLNFTSIQENGTTRVKTIHFPNHGLISVRSTQTGAGESAVTLNPWGDWSKNITEDEFIPVTSSSVVDSEPKNRLYSIVNTNQLAASIDSNVLWDKYRHKCQMIDKGSYKKFQVWAGYWIYREVDTEITELPWAKIYVTADANSDGIVDWQDGAIAHRNNMTEPLGAGMVRNSIAHLAANSVGMAQMPFTRILDNVKRLYMNLDGFSQMLLLKGYQAEGHDSSNLDYAGNWNERAGGLTDLTTLLNNAPGYNCNVGVHINHTECQPEARNFNYQVATQQNGWFWYDQAKMIDRTYDTASGGLYNRLSELEAAVPNIPWVYVDVYDGDGWVAWKLASKLNSMGMAIGSEYGAVMEKWQVWAHTPARTTSKIMRFIRNHQQDIYQEHELLKGYRHNGFMAWSGENKIKDVIRDFYINNLPTKYMQNSPIKKWTDTGIDFENGTSVRKESGIVNLYSKDEKKIATGSFIDPEDTANPNKVIGFDKVFIPWDPANETKIYHWNSATGSSVWELPASWAGLTTVKLYRTTDTGKVFVTDLPVTNNTVTINATAQTAYVIYKTAQSNPAVTYGTGSIVKDPGFESYGFTNWSKSSTYSNTDHVYVTLDDKGRTPLEVYGNNGADATIQQTITGLAGGKRYVASVWTQVTGGRTATIGVKNYGGPEVSKSVSETNVINYINEYQKTNYQRIKVVFDVPVGYSSAIVYLKANVGTAASKADFDNVRVKEIAVIDKGGHYYYEDFESGDEGWGPFVPGFNMSWYTHLSELHEGYTDDTINGRYSLKESGWVVPGCDGIVAPGPEFIRTLPSELKLEPNTAYTLSFDYLVDNSEQYSVVIRTNAGGATNEVLNVKLSNTSKSFRKCFTTGTYGDYYIAFIKNDANTGKFVVDNFAVDIGAPALPDTYRQNFETGIGGWTIKEGSGAMAVENGELSVQGANEERIVAIDNNSPDIENGIVSCTIKTQADARCGVVFRYTSSGTWASIAYGINGEWIWKTGDQWGYLTQTGPVMTNGSTHDLKVKFVGQAITVWVDDVQIFNGTLSSLPGGKGKVGIVQWYNSHCHYDNFVFNQLYSNDFPDSNIRGMQVAAGNGTIALENSELSLSSNGACTYVVDNYSPSLADGEYEFTMKTLSSQRCGGVVRYSSPSTLAFIAYDTGNTWIWQNGQGQWGVLTQSGPSLADGSTHKVKVRYIGTTWTAWVDGTQIFNGTLSQLPTTAGKAGFGNWMTAHTHFDDMEISRPQQ